MTVAAPREPAPTPLTEEARTVDGSDAMAENLARAHQQLVETTRRAPYLAVAGALGLGVVLGGGLPTWSLRLAAGTFFRMIAAQLAHSLMVPRARAHPEERRGTDSAGNRPE